MIHDWMPTLWLPLTAEQFRQLPRNAAYRYELLEDRAAISPRPRFYHAVLDLRCLGEPPGDLDDVELRALRDGDWPGLVPLFTAAFRDAQPFAGLDDTRRQEAAAQALERTRSGGDGPLIETACFVAAEGLGELAGAVLVTLVPATEDCYIWWEPAPPGCVERRLGRAHLTWIFVGPSHK